MRRVILASQSPNRRELLSRCGVTEFDVVPSRFDEYIDESRDVRDIVRELALGKAREVADRYPDAWVIGGDTLVSYEGRQIGKPRDAEDALATLTRLQGTNHQVSTGIAVICRELGVEKSDVETVDVYFAPQTDERLREYIATGDPMDKAGSYGIQSKGGFLVDHIDGDPTSVVGLPVELTTRLLRMIGIII